MVKQVVYDEFEFMKQIRTFKHSFNTTDTANYRVQLAVFPSIKNSYNNHNHNNTVLKKKLTNKYTKKFGIFNWSRDYSRSKKSTETSWSSAQHEITVNQLKLLHPYCTFSFLVWKAQ